MPLYLVGTWGCNKVEAGVHPGVRHVRVPSHLGLRVKEPLVLKQVWVTGSGLFNAGKIHDMIAVFWSVFYKTVEKAGWSWKKYFCALLLINHYILICWRIVLRSKKAFQHWIIPHTPNWFEAGATITEHLVCRVCLWIHFSIMKLILLSC